MHLSMEVATTINTLVMVTMGIVVVLTVGTMNSIMQGLGSGGTHAASTIASSQDEKVQVY